MNGTLLLPINYSETVIGFVAVPGILPVIGVFALAAILAVADILRLNIEVLYIRSPKFIWASCAQLYSEDH